MAVPNHKLPIQTGATGLQLAEAMMGSGIIVVSAFYEGDTKSSGIYSQGNIYSPGIVPSDGGIILSTGNAGDFTNATGANNQSASRSTDTAGVNGDAQMNAIAGTQTYDDAFLTTNFTSTGSELTMQLVFSSEEYLEWVNTGFNDAVGIWVNGVQAKLALGAGDISIDNINTTTNPNLFLNNGTGIFNTEMDRATVVLTLKAAVSTTGVNALVIKIADAGDPIYDSNLLIVADSVQSALLAHDDVIMLTSKGRISYDLLVNDTTLGRSGVQVTQTNGHVMTAADALALGTGAVLTLNSHGTVSVDATASSNHVTFTYQIADAAGVTDTAYITLATDPVDGTAGNDTMAVGYSDTQGNQIDGTDGMSEFIFGYAGNDKISGGLGHDDICGGTGGDDNDLLLGGAGHDHFSFASGSGTDRVKGFAMGVDQIVIDGVDVAQVEITHHGANCWVQWGTTDKIILSQIDPNAIVTAETLGIGFGFGHFA